LSAQVARTESTLRDVHSELEERTRLLARTKKSVESLQRDLQRAQDSEASSRELARERQVADARRIAELERQLANTARDDTSREVNNRALVARLASSEQSLEVAKSDRARVEGELEAHRADAVASARVIQSLRRAVETLRETAETREARLSALETEREDGASSIRSLVASASALRETERRLRSENARLVSALHRAVATHEGAAVTAHGSLKNEAASASFSHPEVGAPGVPDCVLSRRLWKLRMRVKELAEREARLFSRQKLMTEAMDGLRRALDSERAGRVAAEARRCASEEEPPSTRR
jgi:myosin heavy subunit